MPDLATSSSHPAWMCPSHLPCWPQCSGPELVYIILTAYLRPVYISLFLCQKYVLAAATLPLFLAFVPWHIYEFKSPSQPCWFPPKISYPFSASPQRLSSYFLQFETALWIAHIKSHTACRGSFAHDLPNGTNSSLSFPEIFALPHSIPTCMVSTYSQEAEEHRVQMTHPKSFTNNSRPMAKSHVHKWSSSICSNYFWMLF